MSTIQSSSASTSSTADDSSPMNHSVNLSPPSQEPPEQDDHEPEDGVLGSTLRSHPTRIHTTFQSYCFRFGGWTTVFLVFVFLFGFAFVFLIGLIGFLSWIYSTYIRDQNSNTIIRRSENENENEVGDEEDVEDDGEQVDHEIENAQRPRQVGRSRYLSLHSLSQQDGEEEQNNYENEEGEDDEERQQQQQQTQVVDLQSNTLPQQQQSSLATLLSRWMERRLHNRTQTQVEAQVVPNQTQTHETTARISPHRRIRRRRTSSHMENVDWDPYSIRPNHPISILTSPTTIDNRSTNHNTRRRNPNDNNFQTLHNTHFSMLDMEELSFQTQLALAILESQRYILETGGYGRPLNDNDDDENHPPGSRRGVTEETQQNWKYFTFQKQVDSQCIHPKKDSLSASNWNENENPKKNISSIEEDTCSICLCEYDENEMITELPCSHTFHSHCIHTWVRSNIRCPLCNINLENSTL